MADQAPDDWSKKIMHGSVSLPGLELNGADVASYEAPKGFSLSVQLANAEEAERVFRELADGGSIMMPLEKTFWAERFGMVVDRFGIPWLINCGE
jgi:PhnB protein